MPKIFENKEIFLNINEHVVVEYEWATMNAIKRYRKRYVVDTMTPKKHSAVLLRYDGNYQPGQQDNIYFPERLRIATSGGRLQACGMENHNRSFYANAYFPVNEDDGLKDGPVIHTHYDYFYEKENLSNYGYAFGISAQPENIEGRFYAYNINGKIQIKLEINKEPKDIEVIIQKVDHD